MKNYFSIHTHFFLLAFALTGLSSPLFAQVSKQVSVVLCDKIEDGQIGKNLYGTFDSFNEKAVGSNETMVTLILFRHFPKGAHEYYFEILDPEGESVVKTRIYDFYTADVYKIHQHSADWELSIGKTGLYEFWVYVDNEPVTMIYIPVGV